MSPRLSIGLTMLLLVASYGLVWVLSFWLR